MVLCKCYFVDGRDVDIKLNRNANGLDLFNRACQFLNIQDKAPFGLTHRDGSKPSTYNWWVRLDKPLRKQIKGKCRAWIFALVVKFYPKENIESCEEILRYHTLLQVRDDLLTGRLPCPQKTLAILAAYWAQSEFGPFSFKALDQQLAEAFRFVRPSETTTDTDEELHSHEVFSSQMIELHMKLRKMSASDADIKFLQLASSLPMYGAHYYPAFEWDVRSQKRFNKRPPELTNPVTIGVGFKGVYVHKAKKHTPQYYPWHNVHAIAYRKQLLLIKLYQNGKTKDRTHICLAFEHTSKTKTVWRAAIEMHVHCRVEKKAKQNQVLSVKLKRRWSFSAGQPHTTTSVKSVSTPILRLPKLATIAEGVQASTPPQKKEKSTKESISEELKHKYGAFFPLNSTKALTPRTTPRQKRHSTSLAHQDFEPFIGNLNKKPTDMHSLSFSHLPRNGVEPKPTVFQKDFSSGPPSSGRSKTRRTVSETSVSGMEVFSSSSDQHGVTRRNEVKRAQSYTEEHNPEVVDSRLEGHPASRHPHRRRPQSAPSQQRPHSGRSFNEISRREDIPCYPEFSVSSRRQRAAETKIKRNVSPPPTIKYEDEPSRRKPDQYQSADNFERKDWTLRREPVYAFDQAARRFADVYKHEYLRNLTDDPLYGSYRRTKSMHALGSHNRRLNRSPSLDCHLSRSSSTVSAQASSGSPRSVDSFPGPYYNEDFYNGLSALPPDSSLSRRILSESRLHTRPIQGPTYDMHIEEPKHNRGVSARVYENWNPAGREASAYSTRFNSRESFF